MTVWAKYRYYVDWDNDGDFGEATEDVTDYVIRASWEHGRDNPSQLEGRSIVGSSDWLLDNSSDMFSSYNSGSPIYGQVLPNRRCKITMQIGSGTIYTKFYGYLESIVPVSATIKKDQTATLRAHGVLGYVAEKKAIVEMHTDIHTGTAIGEVLDAIDFDPAQRAIDTGLSNMGRWWEASETGALEAMRRLEDTECGFLREGQDGKIIFESRAHRLAHSSVATYTNEKTGSVRYATIKQEDALRGIRNKFTARVRTFDTTDGTTVLWTLPGTPVSVAAGATLVLTAKFPSEQTSLGLLAVDEWTIVNVFINAAPDGSGDDISDDFDITLVKTAQQMTLTLKNNGAITGYITESEAIGVAVVEGDAVEISNDPTITEDSIAEYGELPYTLPDAFIEAIDEAKAFCDHLATVYMNPIPAVVLTINANVNSNHLNEALLRDVSDKVRIVGDTDTGLHIDGYFFIERIRHEVQMRYEANVDSVHALEFTCTAVSGHDWSASTSSYTPKIIVPSEVVPGARVPDDLQPVGFDPGGRVDVGIVAWKYNEDIVEGEIRAKFYAGGAPDYVDLRTVAEGGTLTHNPGAGEWILTGLAASYAGVNTSFICSSYGRVYYAGRLKNGAGWSVWSDGNDTPTKVRDFVAIESNVSADGGPPADSIVTLEMVGNGVVPHATRPAINGNTLLFGAVIIKDGNIGDWYEIDADTGPAETYYDGSGVDHVYDKAAGTITGPAGCFSGLTTGMIMVDVRNNSAFDRDWCQWGGMPATGGFINDHTLRASGFRMSVAADSGQQWQHVRIKIVKPIWEWTGYGYFGGTAGHGNSWLEFWPTNGDKTTKEFTFPLIPLDAATPMSNIIGRVYWENKVCRAACGENSQTPLEDTGSPAGASGLQIITHTQDATIPVGMMKLAWYRDTLNYESIYTAGFWLSNDLPAQGPFSMERAAHAGYTIETGSGAVVVAENNKVTVTRGATPIPEHSILCIFTNDADPDNDLDGEYIDSADTTGFTMHTPFHKSGTYSYAVIKRWMDTGTSESENLKYLQFKVPDEIGGNREAIRWITGTVPMPSGLFYVTGASRNSMGLGTRMTCSSATQGGVGCIQLNIIAGTPNEVYTEVGETTTFFIDATTSFKLMNPTGNIYCGRPIVYLIRQPAMYGPSEIEFDTKFRVCEEIGAVTLSVAPGALDYLGIIYFALEDKFDVVAFVHRPA